MHSTAIIGVGNKLMGDEGVGIHAIEYMRETLSSPQKRESQAPSRDPRFHGDDMQFDLIDAGTGGVTLLHMFEEYDRVILIDCADFGGTPGEVKRFDLEKVSLTNDDSQISLHGTSIAGILELGKRLGKKIPKIDIVAVQPAKLDYSMDLSKECSLSLETIATVAKGLLR